jgi:crotonobetainyl-CoA:carnitine CoA-transferase CaiB-like acyl-CoA transferase
LPRLNPGNADSVAPSIGQHTRVVLAELDYTNAEIEEMAANSVIRL